MRSLRKPVHIYLYADPSTKTLHLREVGDYLTRLLGRVRVELRGEFLSTRVGEERLEEVARELASIRVKGPYDRVPREPLHG